ncbi:hypothetical protein BCR44DRAFT_1234567 [Catenaria anguillulae PL171]|uniref:Uncharacterized protein n=1 Tax=Catenaria anguillulae PL171 TaxID=765915 RepID=A0A1Y2HDF9_9FUNG|nr:hypothetical protein BCR44DRAFT_1234567 [Catenaria anguillulae PL171]
MDGCRAGCGRSESYWLVALAWLDRLEVDSCCTNGRLVEVVSSRASAFATPVAMHTDARIRGRDGRILSHVHATLEHAREDVAKVMFGYDCPPVGSDCVSALFGWVEVHGRSTVSGNQADLFCHDVTKEPIIAKYSSDLQRTSAAIAHAVNASLLHVLPQVRCWRHMTDSSRSSSEISDESFAAFLTGRVLARTRSRTTSSSNSPTMRATLDVEPTLQKAVDAHPACLASGSGSSVGCEEPFQVRAKDQDDVE